MAQNQDNLTSTITFDAEYTIKFPDLIFGIVGLITNTIHLYFLILALKKHSIFQFLSFICIGDMLCLGTDVVIEFKGILEFSEYKNCHSGYFNTADFWFKAVFLGLSNFGIYTTNWLLLLLAILQILDNKKRAVYTPKITATVIRGTVATVLIFTIVCQISLVIMFVELPYAPCNTQNLKKYMTTHQNWITVVTWITGGSDYVLGLLRALLNVLLIFYLPILTCKLTEKRKKRRTKLILFLIFSYALPDFLAYFFGLMLPKIDLESEKLGDQVKTSIEFGRIFRTLSSNLRPIIIFAKSPEYQDTVKAIFTLTGTVTAPIRDTTSSTRNSIHPA